MGRVYAFHRYISVIVHIIILRKLNVKFVLKLYQGSFDKMHAYGYILNLFSLSFSPLLLYT